MDAYSLVITENANGYYFHSIQRDESGLYSSLENGLKRLMSDESYAMLVRKFGKPSEWKSIKAEVYSSLADNSISVYVNQMCIGREITDVL